MDIIGFLGAFCLTICAIPQAIKAYQEGHANGVSGATILLWLAGEIFMLSYVIGKHGMEDIPLVLNYSFNLIVIGVIFKYKYFNSYEY